MRRNLTALLLFSCAVSATGAEPRSTDFIRSAVESHLFEVQAGDLAQTKAASSGVKEFGAKLAADHAQGVRNSQRVASEVGAAVPQAPSATQVRLLAAMSKLEGEKFDALFIKTMLDDHMRELQRYEAHAKIGSDAVAAYAAESLQLLRDHVKALQGLQNERSTR